LGWARALPKRVMTAPPHSALQPREVAFREAPPIIWGLLGTTGQGADFV
jgi:hypothetical protein